MTGAIQTLFIAAALVLVAIWAVLWIIFPVFVYFGMKRMEKTLNQIEVNSRVTSSLESQ